MEKESSGVLAELALQCVADSELYFPNLGNNISHHALAMAGEVGEFCNIVKKIERGSLDGYDAKVKLDMAMELTDVFIYLLNIAGLLRIDLEAAYKMKRGQNHARFASAGNGGPDKQDQPGLSIVRSDVPDEARGGE